MRDDGEGNGSGEQSTILEQESPPDRSPGGLAEAVAVEIPATGQVDADGQNKAEQEQGYDDGGRAYCSPAEQQERQQAFERGHETRIEPTEAWRQHMVLQNSENETLGMAQLGDCSQK